MPVNIRKKSRSEEPVVPRVVAAAAVPARPAITKTIRVGKADILPDMDVHDVPGRTKFLVNMHKVENGTAIWYRVMGYDENTGQMKLRSRHKNTFDAKLLPTITRHYMVVMESDNAIEPSQEVLSAIKKLVIDSLASK